jgi:hypothetical protein
MLWSARPLGGALDVAKGACWLGQGARAQSFIFQLILGGSLAKCAHKYSCKLLVFNQAKTYQLFPASLRVPGDFQP